MNTEEKIEEYQRRIKVMDAFDKGGALQYKQKVESKWYDLSDPMWEWGPVDYRIKPEPREFWLNVYSDDNPYSYLTKEQADRGAGSGRTECIKVREVL